MRFAFRSNGRTGRHLAALSVIAVGLMTGFGAQAQQVPITKVSVPLSDARNIGANSVRFSAAQDTGTATAPNIVLFGISKESWPRIRDAIQQAVAQGYPVRIVFIGPTDLPPSMEIYAQGHQVLVDGLNPQTMSSDALIKLIRDVHREYYGRQ